MRAETAVCRAGRERESAGGRRHGRNERNPNVSLLALSLSTGENICDSFLPPLFIPTLLSYIFVSPETPQWKRGGVFYVLSPAIDGNADRTRNQLRLLVQDPSHRRFRGVDFKIKHLTVGGKKLKLTIWDTAGQERFRTLTSSYYRNTQGIILVYDVTRRETFTNLSEVWAKEVELYSTNQDCIKMLVGNKIDKESDRAVSREEGITFAQAYGCLFLECSARTRANVAKCFEELAQKILEVPRLLEEGSTVKKNILRQRQESQKNLGGGAGAGAGGGGGDGGCC